MHSAGCGPSFKLGRIFGCVAFPKDVIADKTVQDSEGNRSGCTCAECEYLIGIGLLGECVLAEGRHYGVVRAASWSLVRRVV